MQQFFTGKAVVILVAALCCGAGLSAQVTYTQDFETNAFPPTGWTTSTGTGFSLWAHKTTGTNPTCTPYNGTGMARFDSHAAAAGETQELITSVIDYSDLAGSTATFSLWVYRDTGVIAAEDSLTITVNTTPTDTGATWIGSIARNVNINLPNTETASGWYQYTFNIPNSFNTNTNYIIINGTSQDGNNIFVDNVEWIAYPTQCSGIPNAGTVNGTNPIICGGTGSSALTLHGVTTGLGGLSYEWQSGTTATGPWTNFDSTTAASTGTITSTTYYRFVATCSYSGLADTSAVYTVVVSSNSAPVLTVTPITSTYCGSGFDTLAVTGAAVYSWSPATGLNTAMDSVVLASPTSTTHYTITGTYLNGCSSTAEATVDVRPAPTVTVNASPDTVCAGASVTLTASTTGFVNGASYAWYPGSITGDSIVVTIPSTILYSVIMTSTGCPATDSVWVYANPLSVAAFGYSTNGLSVSFHDSSQYATAWMWLFGGGNSSSGENPAYTYSAAGTDTVILITTGLCNIPDTATKVITVYPTAINTVNGSAGIAVYPNPASNYATVEFNLGEPEAQLVVFNCLGEIAYTANIAAYSGNKYKQQIDMDKMAAGIYTIRVTSATQSITQELVKQ